MAVNTQVRATSKQLWYLHILTKQDTRQWDISIKEAGDMITVLKARQIESKQRIEIPAAAPAKELTAGPDPDVILAEYSEIVNDAAPADTVAVTLRDATGQEVTVKQSHYLGMAKHIPALDGKSLPGYGVTNMPYLRRNFMFVYIDTAWRDWSINYANRLRNPDYQREIESQGIEVRQLCEVN